MENIHTKLAMCIRKELLDTSKNYILMFALIDFSVLLNRRNYTNFLQAPGWRNMDVRRQDGTILAGKPRG
ncbi:MAG: hypothetical protein ACNA8H_12240 [Anaerolineales bacterium]